jgi:WXXGXW repeat (2 copies)
MKTKLMAMMLLAGGSMFAQTRVSVGIGFGGHGAGFYPPPPAYASYIPPCPGPDYIWVDGYWSPDYGRNTWVAGYWNRQPFDNRFNYGGPRQSFTRGFDRNFSGQDRNRTRASNPGQTRDFGQNQNQNRNRGFGNQGQGGNRNRSNSQDHHQGNGYANGFRGR